MVKINSSGDGNGQQPSENYQAKMAELLRREEQAKKRQVSNYFFVKRF